MRTVEQGQEVLSHPRVSREEEAKRLQIKLGVFGALALLILGPTPFSPYFIIGAGRAGVVYNRFGGGSYSVGQGVYPRVPIIQSVTVFDTRTLKMESQEGAASKDLQQVVIDIVLNYHVKYDAVNEIYVKVGADFQEKVIQPAVSEIVKACASQYPVEEIIVKRPDLKATIERTLRERLLTYNIVLESLNLVNIDFTLAFNKVVEDKQIEEQKIKTAQYQRMQAEENKKRTILNAEAESRSQELLRDSTSREVIALKWIEKWNGSLPKIITGDSGLLMTIDPSDESSTPAPNQKPNGKR